MPIKRGRPGPLLPLIFQKTRRRVQARLLQWFEREGRTFPWRLADRTRRPVAGRRVHDPYVILVAEVMLQQTQTARVIERLPEFLAAFGTVFDLATAPRGDVIRAWRGMGYNNRVLRLQLAAQTIVDGHGGRFPRDVETLAALPGLGLYTASAIACFAFAAEVPVVDVNVARVLGRLFQKFHTAATVPPDRVTRAVAAAAIPDGDAYRWHQALMDLGATICTARRPACERCPLERECLSAHPMEIELFHARHVAAAEPAILGEPRRIWRGRAVELLRGARRGMRADIVVERLVALQGAIADDETRAVMLAMIDGLRRDGLVVANRGDGEGVRAEDRIRIPA